MCIKSRYRTGLFTHKLPFGRNVSISSQFANRLHYWWTIRFQHQKKDGSITFCMGGFVVLEGDKEHSPGHCVRLLAERPGGHEYTWKSSVYCIYLKSRLKFGRNGGVFFNHIPGMCPEISFSFNHPPDPDKLNHAQITQGRSASCRTQCHALKSYGPSGRRSQ